jgi:hypothetical protein
MVLTMSERTPGAQWHGELVSALDQLASVRAEFGRGDGDPEPELIVETAELLARAQLAVGELTRLHPALDADSVRQAGVRGFDPLTFVSTVGITTVALPFLKTLVEKAGADVYEALTDLVRTRRKHDRTPAPADPERVVLDDRETSVRIVIDAGVDASALTALQQIDLSTWANSGADLHWNPRQKKWEPDTDPRPVKLWLPGDPLDEDWPV